MTRFGLQIPNFSFGGPDADIFDHVLERARIVEDAGFESVWVMDHFWQLPPLGGPPSPILEGYTLLGALAARTSRVQLGTLVTGVTYRNPAMLAKMVTTLDVISKGRAILGIGAAWYDVEHDGLGFDFPAVKERFERLEEAVHVCRAMFTEATPSFTGKHYRIHEAHNVPRPLRPSGIPIMIGGSGEKKTLRLVARLADMCNIAGDPETVARRIGILRQHCVDVGRDPAQVTVTRMSTVVPTASAAETAATRDFLAQVAGAESAAAFDVGEPAEIIERLRGMAAAGVDVFIFNMPLAGAEQVAAWAGTVTAAFG